MAVAAQTDIGTGTTALLTTNALGMDLTGIAMNGASRPAIKSSHLATTDADTYIFAERTDWGTITLTGMFNQVGQSPITQMEATVADTLTITFKDTSTWAASVGATEFSFDVNDEEMDTFTATFQITGKPTIVPGTA